MTDQMTDKNLLPVGMSGFESLRQSGKVYVDKTGLIYQLAATEGGKYFLARPRRFGKSLLVSTFESLFKYGLRDFRGLAIEGLWNDKPYATVRLDFSRAKNFSTVEQFQKRLTSLLAGAFGRLGFAYQDDSISTVCDQLSDWLEDQPVSSVVLLIDLEFPG